MLSDEAIVNDGPERLSPGLPDGPAFAPGSASRCCAANPEKPNHRVLRTSACSFVFVSMLAASGILLAESPTPHSSSIVTDPSMGPSAQSCTPGAPADGDHDGDVDSDDFAVWMDCRGRPSETPSFACFKFDYDGDNDVDLQDWSVVQFAYTGQLDCSGKHPVPNVVAAAFPFLGEAPLSVTFAANHEGMGMPESLQYTWTFGDGAQDTGQVVNHVFTNPGDYEATVVVSNAFTSSTASAVVSVADGSFNVNDPVTPNEARRFLFQAAFGPEQEDVDFIVQHGYEAWIDTQRQLPVTELSYDDLLLHEQLGYGGYHSGHIWDDICIYAEDQLRQRMTWALIQIIVMNREQSGLGTGPAMYYYTNYMQRAFGNYRDLLDYVTHSHQMGVFLTYIDNRKADPVTGSSPDENYAREVKQLHTIGLWELNIHGSQMVDQFGEPIPTFDNEVVKQFARIFTGFVWNWQAPDGQTPYYPMLMKEQYHEFGSKQLLDYPGAVPPGGWIPAIVQSADQTEEAGLEDVQLALDNLFYHPNVAPFVSRLLIQRFVTSNPTPSYIERVATAFEGGGPYGSGQRGDLFATLKAILLDNEARDPAYRSNPQYGKVQEPIVLRWALYRIMDRIDRPNESFPFQMAADPWVTMADFGQNILESPSVFNFYPAQYAPPGTDISGAEIVAPELNLYNDVTALAILQRFLVDLILPEEEYEAGIYDAWRAVAGDAETLVDRLNDDLMYGSMSDEMKQIIVNVVAATADHTDRVQSATWLIVNSPEFRVLK